jgi:CheY-like chemotaxis protein
VGLCGAPMPRSVGVGELVSGYRPRCRVSHRVRTDFSGMPADKAKFFGHPPDWQEAVKLEVCVLRIRPMEAPVINLKIAVRTTLLLVDDHIEQLDLLALTMKMTGFSVVTASSPNEAISMMNEHCLRNIDVAVIDYHMPTMNGCVLAAYLKDRYPELKIILRSAAPDISRDEMMSADGFISKSDGIGALLSKITELGRIDPASPARFARESEAFMEAVN